MTNKIKIRCLFGKDPDNAKWHLIEALEHEAWAVGDDFKREESYITDWRELTIEIDDARVQEILGGTEVVQGEVVADCASAEDEKAMRSRMEDERAKEKRHSSICPACKGLAHAAVACEVCGGEGVVR